MPYGYPTGIWDWVGNTQTDNPLMIYASPGKYGVAALNYEDRYILGRNGVTFTSAAGQSVALDASKMALDSLTFHFDGIGGSETYFYANVPFSQPDPCCGQWMAVQDGQSVLVGLNAGTPVQIRAVINQPDGSGTVPSEPLARGAGTGLALLPKPLPSAQTEK